MNKIIPTSSVEDREWLAIRPRGVDMPASEVERRVMKHLDTMRAASHGISIQCNQEQKKISWLRYHVKKAARLVKAHCGCFFITAKEMAVSLGL
jgi:hypothetical protein